MAKGAIDFHIDKLDLDVLRRMIRTTPGRAQDFLDAEAETIVNDVKLSFGTSPAPANQPPGVDTGTLRASIRWEREGDWERRILDGVLYGVILEWGSTRHNFVWPFMSPAFEREQRVFGGHARDWEIVKP